MPEHSQEHLEPESILVPKDTAKAFGHGLKQRLSSSFQEIETSLGVLAGNPNYQKMKDNFEKIPSVVDGLERAKEVRIVNDGPGNDFEFSEEIEDAEIKPGEIIIDANMTQKIVNALNHTTRNPLFILSGLAENDQSEEARRIMNNCNKIEDVLSSFKNAKEIIVSTDNEGNTQINPIRASS